MPGNDLQNRFTVKRLCGPFFAEKRFAKSDDCFLQFVSLGFDAATSDIFTALCSGSRLCLAAKDSVSNRP